MALQLRGEGLVLCSHRRIVSASETMTVVEGHVFCAAGSPATLATLAREVRGNKYLGWDDGISRICMYRVFWVRQLQQVPNPISYIHMHHAYMSIIYMPLLALWWCGSWGSLRRSPEMGCVISHVTLLGRGG